MSSADRTAYSEYVTLEYQKFLDHTGGAGYVWSENRLARVHRTMPPARDAWRGPWRNVRPYVTTEFRQWIEEHWIERLTFSEWQTARIHERREAVESKRDYIESADYCLDRLETWAELNRERDEQICEARERGATFKDLMSATGLTRMTIHNVLERARRAQAGEVIAAAETITAGAAEVERVLYEGQLVEVF